MSAIAAAVIAGGPGTRMGGGGVTKSALEIGGRTIAAWQVQALQGLFAPVVAVAADAAPWAAVGIEVVADRYPGAGPLAGIHAALLATADCDGVVCVAGDMPFLAPALLRLLRDHEPAAHAVAPRLDGRAEPMLARFSSRCLAPIEAQLVLASGDRAVHRFLDRIAVSWLDETALRAADPDLRSFTNINTPEELARARGAAV